RILKFLGDHAISDNHIGDWGTQFGMIIYGYKHFVDRQAIVSKPVAELSRLYRLVNSLVEYHEARSEKIPTVEKKIEDTERQRTALRDAPPLDNPKQAKSAAKQLRQTEGQLADLRSELAALRGKVEAIEND